MQPTSDQPNTIIYTDTVPFWWSQVEDITIGEYAFRVWQFVPHQDNILYYVPQNDLTLEAWERGPDEQGRWEWEVSPL